MYTIGDCYVVMGINDAHNREIPAEAYNVVIFAFSLIDIINDVKKNE